MPTKKLMAVTWLFIAATTAGAQSANGPAMTGVTKVEVTQHTDHAAGPWDRLPETVEKLAWPITVLTLVFIFKHPIMAAIQQLGARGGEINVAGLAIKFPLMQEASLGDDVLTFKASDPLDIIANSSAKTTLLRMLREPGLREYAVIDLGDGNEWITSRLFIFALMLQRMKGVRCLVFLEGSVPKFLGAARPDRIRWSLAQEQPWLEKSYLTAVSQSVQFQLESFIVSSDGALDPQTADNVVRTFVGLVATAARSTPPPTGKQWASWGTNIESGTWLSGAELKRMLGENLQNDVIVASNDHRAEARALVECTAPFVARVKNTGEFVSLIDRTTFLGDVAMRLIARLDSLAPNAAKM